ncbi:MAG: ROK family protein [Pygmaiobacter sp.]
MVIGQPHLIKEYNQDLIQGLIAERGPVTKPELSAITKLSLPTVNKVVDGLERIGLVLQGPESLTTVGRRAKTYVLNDNAGYIIVLYYQRGQIDASLRNLAGKSIWTERCAFTPSSLDEAMALLTAIIAIPMQKHAEKIQAIGLGIPGVVNNTNVITSIPLIPCWNAVNLKALLEAQFNLPVFVENDVKLMTVGYYTQKISKKCKNMVFLYLGEGLGSGLIIDRKLYRGTSCFAGEYGYMSLTQESSGTHHTTLEEYVSAIVKKMEAASDTAEKGRCHTELCDLLARVTVNFSVIVDPELIAIYSPYLGNDALERMRQQMDTFLPQGNRPELVQVDEEYGVQGTFRLCLANVTTKMKMVQQKGV